MSETLTRRRRRRKRMLVSRRITQDLIESGSLVDVRGDIGFVDHKTCIYVLQACKLFKPLIDWPCVVERCWRLKIKLCVI